MSFKYHGTCHCNQVELLLTLPSAIEQYAARACDCDFCSDNNTMFLSDKRGELSITSTISLGHAKQGSGQAEFLRCVNCEQVVAVVANVEGHLLGAINSECLHDSEKLQRPKLINGPELNAKQKRERWKGLWSPTTLSEPD
ncbi:hypothetical protein KJ365_11755 [Glaciecola sp. XM2]|uniref:hypothetical protein n=1 Tax=Glaciecola sp. XM2 TaxID=1914931 RepID=UPI001BDE2509|nr:hypothetical protein [Glaciecola sp. XM2]MBT1451556.1 hypothetical protein [Glaciecola sp. XM2]